MAFVKLLPPEGGAPLSVADVIRRLADEFAEVHADPDAGQDHVAGMIAATLRFSDALPGKWERLARLQSVQHAAVCVSFGDDLGNVAACCVMPDSELFFGSPDEVDGPAWPLVERAASALGYRVDAG
ncbi:hypothetical protein GobsT_67360 [Gemmata obscuriglobus]|uniref:Uncharacterized protein n=1 Tax=Gemmata obscuriglobus TaxID=114 RepID=A0A2Z3GN07_9BACT|nr:hypothetical protein [Gemmata obscuriglobus]AWM35589.1 hypothetical protein C1280_00160 [Gemmata obscuriglobus]QEG31889.1 hypothetical protein GobsT_67360 [Gemmata obscuriglobus]VTS11235.1 Uncharacterized protein OS=Pirellula staleyi (strain ATCC 27377 / DSM 6068 / ICPB 4128) GN=Psta_0433 PE=4 SV=1 [Gemmata obscuriglobus UQM 2246]